MEFVEIWNITPSESLGSPCLTCRVSVGDYFTFDLFYQKAEGKVLILGMCVKKKWMIPSKMLPFIMGQMKKIMEKVFIEMEDL